MTSKRIRVSDKFDESTCGVCGECGINQYFAINDNFIDYNGTFYSLREILSSALDFQISAQEGLTTEICLDCKDKVVKFYHFKRRAKEIHKRKLQANRVRSPRREKKSKVVHDIVKIVENYTEKCPISTIRIDESSKKLIIEPESAVAGYSGSTLPVIAPHKQELPLEAEYIRDNPLTAVVIKQEPGLMIEENSFNDDESMLELNRDEDDPNYSAGETSQQYYGGDSSEPGTSYGRSSQKRRSQSQPNEDPLQARKRRKTKTDYSQTYRKKIYSDPKRHEELKARDRARKKMYKLKKSKRD